MATDRDWPWDKLGQKERRMFALVRAYMDYHNLWSGNGNSVDHAIKAIVAMTDAEVEAFLEMYLVDRMVNK